MYRMTPLMFSRYRFASRILERYAPQKDCACLEIGCGAGDFLKMLESRHYMSIKAVDLSGENVAIARGAVRKTQIRQADLFDLKERFDLVVMFEVLEHIEDDERALRHLSENVVAKGGLLMLSVPSDNAPNILSFGHFRHYKKGALISLLEKAGFKVILFYSYGTRLVNSLGIRLLKKRYGAGKEMKRATEESSRIEFPFIWRRVLYPVISKFYPLFHLLDYHVLKDTDLGVDYFVLCKK